MLYREKVDDCSDFQAQYINGTMWVEYVNVEPGGTHSNHWALKNYGVNTVELLPACKCL